MTLTTSLRQRLLQLRYQPKRWLIAGIVTSLTLLLTACSDTDKTAENTQNLLRISTAPGDFHDLVKEYLAPELKKEGFDVELLVITDTVVPNVAVEEGSLEMNLFQHRPYMEEFNRNQKGKLIPLVQVPTAPYGISILHVNRRLPNLPKVHLWGFPPM